MRKEERQVCNAEFACKPGSVESLPLVQHRLRLRDKLGTGTEFRPSSPFQAGKSNARAKTSLAEAGLQPARAAGLSERLLSGGGRILQAKLHLVRKRSGSRIPEPI